MPKPLSDDDDEVFDPDDDDGDDGGEPRPRRVRAAGRVRSVADWEALRDRLDVQVRQLLAEGFEVELEG